MFSYLHRLSNMFYSSGRILDFYGVYNSHMIEEIYSESGFERDRKNFERDGQALYGDMWRAYHRLKKELEQGER